jgi:hypothetical protein
MGYHPRMQPVTELETLLAQAASAPPGRRIEWRDRIAAHGDEGIEAVSPWLADEVLAPFAVRVIDRAGLDGHAEAAIRALRASRKHAPEDVRSDIDWALRRLQPARATTSGPGASGGGLDRPARPAAPRKPR